MIAPLEVLKKYWKYDSFKEPQEEIITSVLLGKHVLAILPTGAGKSICFQIPALIKEGICVVVSPLVALMQDQVKRLRERDIKALALTSSLRQNEIVEQFDNLRYGNYKFLYLSPERLQSEFIQEKIKQLDVRFIAIDEAHCISEWGHDFRPAYRKINTLIKIHPNATVIALTATATSKVSNDILINLELNDVVKFKNTLMRPELAYKVEKVEDINYKIRLLLSKHKQPAIVYVSNRKATKNISEYLNKNGLKSSYYHGGLLANEKQEAYQNWLDEKTPIMVATNAFGMGIDKSNVTTIIHANLPFSLENYLQESGRAGRNGQRSEAYLLYNQATINQFEKQFKKGILSIDFLKEVYQKLNQFYRIVNGEKPDDFFQFDLNEFCNTYKLPFVETFAAIDILQKEGIIELNQNLNNRSSLKFIVNQKQLFNYSHKNKELDKLIKTILRTYGGLFDQYTNIDEFIISKKAVMPKELVISLLNKIHSDKIADYKMNSSSYMLRFLVPREDSFVINSISRNIKQRHKIKQQKFDAVLDYANNSKVCRTVKLLNYFNDNNIDPCGTCDICSPQNKPIKSIDYIKVSELIMQLLVESGSATSREIIEQLELDKNLILTTLQFLLEKNKITLTSHNKFELIINA